MAKHRFERALGGEVILDLCFPCQGIWFDHRENLKLSPQAVVELFTLLHQHRTDERRPLQRQLACPRCGSENTTETSHFSSTACKALYRCLACMEPFDYFKPY